jgi:CRP-like cAMP-binding protein
MNSILSMLPAGDLRRLQPKLECVQLRFGEEIYATGQRISHVYFPLNSLISLLTAVDARRSLEVGMVGNEGMAGLPLILGVEHSAGGALVQGAGDAIRMDARSFRAEFRENLALQTKLFRYTFALMAQISQTAACNRFHAAEPRLARWLLMTRERVGADEFRLTHALLANMLGLRREGVTEAATSLRQRGLIDYARGAISILDVVGLKRAACSCYAIVGKLLKRS